MSFSQRHGYSPAEKAIQLEALDDELRAGLWDAVHIHLWVPSQGYRYGAATDAPCASTITLMWHLFFKRPVDTIPFQLNDVIAEVREYFFDAQWFQVYDFIEFVAPHVAIPSKYRSFCNDILSREKSAYRFVDSELAPISSAHEKEAIEDALSDGAALPGVAGHLRRALELLADRRAPDFRNSIKESVSAVESLCRYLTADDKATLGAALSILEKEGLLHPALKRSWSSLYGYTNDEDGVRHAMLEQPRLTYVDAKYFLVACSAFISFMLGKVAELDYAIPKR